MKVQNRLGILILISLFIIGGLLISTRSDYKGEDDQLLFLISQNCNFCRFLAREMRTIESNRLGDEELKKLRQKVLLLENYLEQTNVLLYKALEDLEVLSGEKDLRHIPNEIDPYKPPYRNTKFNTG